MAVKESEKTKTEKTLPDLTGYTEYKARPQKVLAKRLTEEKIYTTSVNGTEQEYKGHPGQVDVYFLTPDGNAGKNEPYDVELFNKKFTTGTEEEQALFGGQ